jgi:hypothetical protein
MYEHYPSVHFEMARQKIEHRLEQADKDRLAAKAVAENDGRDRLVAVKGVFAGILAAVTNLGSRTRPVPQRPGLQTS